MTTDKVDKLYGQFSPQERLTLLLEAMAREDWSETNRLRDSTPEKAYVMGDLAYESRREFVWQVAALVAADLRVTLGKLTIYESFAEMCPYITGSHAMAAEFSFMAGWRLGKGLAPLPSPTLEEGDEEGDDVDVDAYREAAREGTGVTPWLDDRDVDWKPTKKQIKELDAWDAPKAWVELANRRLAGLYRPLMRVAAGAILGTWAAWDAFCVAHLGVDGDTAMRAHVPSVPDAVAGVKVRYAEVKPREERRAEYAKELEEAWGKRFGV